MTYLVTLAFDSQEDLDDFLKEHTGDVRCSDLFPTNSLRVATPEDLAAN